MLADSISPIKSIDQAPKRAKEVILHIKDGLLTDYWCEIRENQKRIEKILCSQIDIREMYLSLRQSASVIPCPRPLFFADDFEKSATETADRCSIEDRKKAVLALFSRRFGLKLCAETIHLAVGILDQCLEKMLVEKKAISDLAAVSLVLASKVEEINCIHMSGLLECGLIENRSLSMICVLERVVLNTLSYQVTFPTPLTFATYLLVHLHASPSTINLTHYLLELSVLYVHNRLYPSDVVAHAATCLAFAVDLGANTSSYKSLVEAECRLALFCGIEVASKTNRDVMRTLADLFIVAPAEDHVIHREYSSSRRHSVALRQIDISLQKALKMNVAL
uniref:Cyclin N-terminal domain-containing protein n=1 Tax=Caenorhabditis japonica TaxID=281687 RepID=A0A8R1IDA7_CAEJA